MYNEIADIYLEIFPINQAFLSFILKYLGKPGSKVLDLGCGPGDYVDALSRSGYRVTGIDNSSVMITQAKANKQGSFYNYSFTEIDQLEGAQNGEFDCVYCIGNSLSYLQNDEMRQFLANVKSLLNTGGFFVLQVVNWDRLYSLGKSDFPINSISRERTFHRRYEWINPAKVIFHTEIRQGGEILNSWAAPLYPKYFDAIKTDLQTIGIKIISVNGDYGKSPFDSESSPATILVAQKT